jgi:hypothetical protein
MANSLRQSIVAIAALSFCAAVRAGTAPGTGVEGTAHDFSNGGTGGTCSFCHTPDSMGDTTLLWDADERTYTWDAPTTVAGTRVPQLRGGPSTRCLNCHDGTVAINTVPRVTGTAVVGANGSLSGHHPVGIPYPLLQVANTYNGVSSGRFLELHEYQSNPTLLNMASIRLFRDDGAGHAIVMQKGETSLRSGIECSSCHDPHNNESKDAHFLRGTLAGNSAEDGFICKQCHAK